MDYWKECIKEAFEDSEIKATDEQTNNVASWVEGAHENYSTGMGHDCIPNPQTLEIEKLKKKLKREQEKTICKECNGTGRNVSYGGTFKFDSQCFACNGVGFIYS